MNTVTQLPFVVVGMVAGGLQLGSPAGSEDVRAVGGAVDLHRGEEPAIKTRRLVVETHNARPFWLSSVDHLCEVTVLSSNLPPLAFGAVEELVRRKRLQLAGVSIGRVVRHVSPSLHRDTLAIRCLYSFTK